MDHDLSYIAGELARYGRNGDDILVHMSRAEIAGLASLAPGRITVNPTTKLPEAFSWQDLIGPILGIGGAMLGLPTWAIAGASGLGTAAATGDLNKGIMSGLLSYGLGSLAGGFGDIGKSAADSATAAETALSDLPAANSSDAARGLMGSAAQATGQVPQSATQMAPNAMQDLGMGQGVNNIWNGMNQPGAFGQVIGQHPFATGAAAMGALGTLGGMGGKSNMPSATSGGSKHVPFLPPGNRHAVAPPPDYMPGIDPEFNYFQGQTPQSGSRGGIVGLPGSARTDLMPPRHGPGMAQGGQPPGPHTASQEPGSDILYNPMFNSPSQMMAHDQMKGMSTEDIMGAARGMAGTDSPTAQMFQGELKNRMVTGMGTSPIGMQQGYAAGGEARENWAPGYARTKAERLGARADMDRRMEEIGSGAGTNMMEHYPFNNGSETDYDMRTAPPYNSDDAVRRSMGVMPRTRSFADGGEVGQKVEENLIMEARAALAGQHPNPASAIERFVEHFGEQAFEQLRASMHEKRGGMIKTPGSGMDDLGAATIEGREPAQLADSEFIVPADVLSGLGSGSSDHGARLMHEMMARVRKARTGTTKQAPAIDGYNYLPA